MLIRRLASWPRVILLLGPIACVPVHPGPASLSPTSDGPAADRLVRDWNVITRAEIEPTEMLSAYDVVAYRRRPWLVTRGMQPPAEWRSVAPLVYLEGAPYGSCETLKSIAANTVDELRFLDALEATTRFGTGHAAGAILVTLRR